MKSITFHYREIKPALHAAFYGNPSPLSEMVKARGGEIMADLEIIDGPVNMCRVEWVDPAHMPAYANPFEEVHLDPEVRHEGITLELSSSEWRSRGQQPHKAPALVFTA